MAVRTGKKRCSKGKSCGETCINRGLVCRMDLSLPLSKSLGKAKGDLSEPRTIKAESPPDAVQDLALSIKKKRLRKEDFSQEWDKLLDLVDKMQGDEKRDATIKANAAIGKRLRINIEHKAESKEGASKAGKEFLAQYDSLKRTVEIIQRYDDLFKSVAKRLNPPMTPGQISDIRSKLSEINAKRHRAEKRLEGIMANVRDKLMQTNLTDKQVRDLVSRVWTPGTSEETKGHMAEFIRLFNGRGFTDIKDSTDGKPVRSLTETNDRAYAKVGKGIVKTNGEKVTTFHEIAHIMEGQRPWMSRFAVQWRDGKSFDNIEDIRNSTGRNLNAQGFYKAGPARSIPLVSFKQLFPGSSYNEEELAVVDKFLKEYMGKVYGAFAPWQVQRVTEVWSVAIQHFASPQAMAVLYKAHPELFEIITGLAVSP